MSADTVARCDLCGNWKKAQRCCLTPYERLMLRVDVAGPDECWLYRFRDVGHANKYPMLRQGRAGASVVDYAHRIIWRHNHGEIPRGMTIDHLCRMKSCCNPAHHELVTLSINGSRGAFARWEEGPAPDVIRLV